MYLKKLKSFEKDLLCFFADSREKKFRVGTIQQERSVNRKDTLLWPNLLESQQLKGVEIPTDGNCVISAWLTCLEALRLTKECDDLIEETYASKCSMLYIWIKLIMI